MRKILSLILVAVMVMSAFSLAACEKASNSTTTPENTETPESEGTKTTDPTGTSSIDISKLPVDELIEKAIEKNLALKSFSMTYNDFHEQNDNGSISKFNRLMNVLVENMDDDKFNFFTDGYIETSGERYDGDGEESKNDQVLAYIDGICYMKDNETSIKISDEDIQNAIYVGLGSENIHEEISGFMDYYHNVIKPIPKEILEGADVKKDGKTTTITLSLTDEQFKSIYKDYYDSNDNAYPDGNDVCSNIKYVMTVNENGYITYFSLKYRVDITYNNETNNGNANVDSEYTAHYEEENENSDYATFNDEKTVIVTFNAPGKSYTASKPADADQYKTMKEYMMNHLRSYLDWEIIDVRGLNLDVNGWDEFFSKNEIYNDLNIFKAFLTWSEFKGIIEEYLNK